MSTTTILKPLGVSCAIFLLLAGCGGDSFGTGLDPAIDGGAGAATEASPQEDAGTEAAPDALHLGAILPEAAVDALATDASPVVDAGAPEAEACAQVTHDNGVQGYWTDCTPLGTYTASEGLAACNAEAVQRRAGACSSSMKGDPPICGASAFAVITGGNQYAWLVNGPHAGSVILQGGNVCTAVGAWR